MGCPVDHGRAMVDRKMQEGYKRAKQLSGAVGSPKASGMQNKARMEGRRAG